MDRFDRILAALPGTKKQLSERTGFTHDRIKQLTDHLRKAGWVFVTDWEHSIGRGGYQPVLALGPGEDVVCSLKPIGQPMTRAERLKRAAEVARLKRGAIIPPLRNRPATPFDALFIQLV